MRRLSRGAKGRLVGWILFFIILYSNTLQSPDGPPTRRPAPFVAKTPEIVEPRLPLGFPEGEGKLRRPNSSDGRFAIDEKPRSPKSVSVGTAFSINANGLWITARHVTDGCDRIMLSDEKYKRFPVNGLIQHPRADVSIFKSNLRAEPLLINFEAPRYGQGGYHFGFPRGEPGDVHSVLMGRRAMYHKSRSGQKENVLVWAERDSFPENDYSLGGISGGPIVNDNGDVVGVHVAGSIRRGRSFSSLPSAIDYLVDKGGHSYNQGNDIKAVRAYLNAFDFPKAGSGLRKQKTVAQVICFTK